MSGWWLAASRPARDAVDESDRGGEVRELELAHDRVPLARRHRRDPAEALLDIVVGEHGHPASRVAAIARSAYSPRGVRIVSLVPHATELLFALGLGAQVVGGHTRVRPPAAGAARARRSRATCCPPG